MMSTYSTIRYETGPDRVATITLDRPQAMNAFDRQMCEEIRDVWRRVKLDPAVNAVVLRAAGDRAFSAGLDVKKAFGQPDDVWNHEDPGEMLSPKWQKCWKPVVCAVQGICTAGAFYFLNEADVVICSSEATFFDSHVTYGRVCAVEPIGLMRRIGLGETLRIALMGNDERVSAETALRIGLVTEVVERAQLWDRAHEIAAGIARHPSTATQGTVRAIWESLDRPYRAAMEQSLIYTRLGNAAGMAEAEAAAKATAAAADAAGTSAPRPAWRLR
ncbi:enoyl-CoA hydratase/isomerase family protein [Frankia sp. EUN1f]|uniref:enoyl-CoA hydratase/isomerase family protein n=1 Tax=Parafrankia sp. EUN1f TaxID=102897 RepID=UPI00056C986E